VPCSWSEELAAILQVKEVLAEHAEPTKGGAEAAKRETAEEKPQCLRVDFKVDFTRSAAGAGLPPYLTFPRKKSHKTQNPFYGSERNRRQIFKSAELA
jgi:hypothetical protein